MDTFTSLRQYLPRPGLDPAENYLTEAFAVVLKQNSQLALDLLTYVAVEAGQSHLAPVQGSRIIWSTQVYLRPGYADLIAVARDRSLFIFEHKVHGPPEDPTQLESYRRPAQDLYNLPALTILVVPRDADALGTYDFAITWRKIGNWILSHGEPGILTTDLVEYLGQEGLYPGVGPLPSFFRACVRESRALPIGYEHAGFHLSIHARELLPTWDEADPGNLELEAALDSNNQEEMLWYWFRKYLPRCMKSVPPKRKKTFLRGVMAAVEEGRL